MTDAMVILQTVLLIGRFARQLWPATLFRDAQAAVVTGNGFRMESFRGFCENLEVFCAESVRDDGYLMMFHVFC
jgi:hypothetical protein